MPSKDNREKREEEDQAMTEPQQVLHHCGREEHEAKLRFLHFNDVYHPQPSENEPKGGAARFKSVCDYYRNDKQFEGLPYPLTLFSGDAFNPSKESTVTKGSHMVPVLNQLGVDAACVGNHEFDFGAAHFAYLKKDCKFPWLLANMDDPELGSSQPLGRCKKTTILETSNGLKVGLIGLVEKEWTEKINSSLPADLEYKEMIDVAKELAPKLREQGADIVVVLSHARQERDWAFCGGLPEGCVDLVLGGHDHWGEHEKFDNNVHFVRSGYDFKNVSYITAFRTDGGKGWDFTVTRRNLNSDIEEDESMKKLQHESTENIAKQLQNVIGSIAVPLDARKEPNQVQETNYGNFLADLMRLNSHADCALINGGTFMAHKIFPSGPLKLQDIVDTFPFEDPIVVMRVTGKAIWEAMENGVSKWPEPDSRWPQVSGIRCRFDGHAEVGKRVKDLSIADKDVEMEKEYTIATRSHLAAGKCGYESIKGRTDGGTAEELVDDENGILVSTLMRQHFTAVQMADVFKHITEKNHNHWDGVLHEMDSALPAKSEDEQKKIVAKRAFLRWRSAIGKEVDLEKQMRELTGELYLGWKQGVVSRVEGRVKMIGDESSSERLAEERRNTRPDAERHEDKTSGEQSDKTSTMSKIKAMVVDSLHKIKK